MNHRLPSAAIAHYRPDIDGLRAVAILLVLWFHAFPQTLPGGFIGVDVFFVISGFLITGIVLRGLKNDTFSFWHFYAQRARRLLPALMVVLPATLFAGWYWLWPQEYQQLATHVAAAAVFILNFVLWTEAGYFDTATELKPLMHLWSLGIEEQFYLLYPCLLWLGWRLRRNGVAIIGGLVAVSFAVNLYLIQNDPSGAFFLPQARFWELAAGGLLAWRQHNKAARPATTVGASGRTLAMWRQMLPWAGLLAIAVGAWHIDPTTRYPGTAALLPVGGSLLLLASGPHTWVSRRILGSRAMVLTDLISYPLYLWHWPILSFLRIVSADTPSVAMRWLAVGLSFLLAWLTFRFVETPIRFGARRVSRLMGIIASVSVTAGVAVFIWAQHGMPQRLPVQAASLLAYQYDYREGYREGSCFLRPEQAPDEFMHCPDTWAPKGETWLLWGDSHAAHLYPGILARFGANATVQRTASGCPPLQGESIANRPHCPAVWQHVWTEIETHRPYRVSLAAQWGSYDWRKLTETIARLRSLGVSQIDLIGPVPHWRNGLPRQLAVSYRESGFNVLPARLQTGLLPEPAQLDHEMALAADALNVRYLSPIQGFCNHHGCLALEGETNTLIAWDDAHLTQAGSRLLIAKWP